MTNQDPNARIDKMGQWAAEIDEWRKATEKSLKMLLAAKIASISAPADEISARLGSALDEQGALPATIASMKAEVAQFRERLSEIDEAVETEEASAMLGTTESNKEKREAQMILFLAESERCQQLRKERRVLDTAMKVKEAQIEELESRDRHLGRLIHVLTAQLENLTARIS